MGFWLDFGRQTLVWNGSNFSFFRFRPRANLFLAKQVRSSGFLEGYDRVRSSVLVDEPDETEFKRVQISTCQVRSSSNIVIV